jgi:hypothetical protein
MKTIKLIIVAGIIAFFASTISHAQNVNAEWSYLSDDNNEGWISMVENNEIINSNLGQINTDTLPIFKIDLGLLAYPNPTTDILYLDKGESDMIHIRVFSCDGKALFSFRTWDQVSELDFSQYDRAYYILNVSNGKYSNTLKIWKN